MALVPPGSRLRRNGTVLCSESRVSGGDILGLGVREPSLSWFACWLPITLGEEANSFLIILYLEPCLRTHWLSFPPSLSFLNIRIMAFDIRVTY